MSFLEKRSSRFGAQGFRGGGGGGGLTLKDGVGCSESFQIQGSENQERIEAASPLRWGGPSDQQSWVDTAKAHFKL